VIPQFLGFFASKAQTELTKPSAKHERATSQEYITHVAQVILQIFDYMLVAEIIIRPASKISKEIKCLCLAKTGTIINLLKFLQVPYYIVVPFG
jgi:hypothetical protein